MKFSRYHPIPGDMAIRAYKDKGSFEALVIISVDKPNGYASDEPPQLIRLVGLDGKYSHVDFKNWANYSKWEGSGWSRVGPREQDIHERIKHCQKVEDTLKILLNSIKSMENIEEAEKFAIDVMSSIEKVKED